MNFENTKGVSLLQLLAGVTGIDGKLNNIHEKSRCVCSGFSFGGVDGTPSANIQIALQAA